MSQTSIMSPLLPTQAAPDPLQFRPDPRERRDLAALRSDSELDIELGQCFQGKFEKVVMSVALATAEVTLVADRSGLGQTRSRSVSHLVARFE